MKNSDYEWNRTYFFQEDVVEIVRRMNGLDEPALWRVHAKG